MIEVINKGNEKAEVLIYDQIGESFFADGVTAKKFAKDVANLGPVKAIDVRINSPGGSVIEGLGIFNTLVRHDADINVFIDGAALSMASVIAMAGQTITMAENALMMIHNPRAFASGESKDMRKAADILDKSRGSLIQSYAKKTGIESTEIGELMDAETWMTADEALEAGFVDSVGVEVDAVATFALPDAYEPPAYLYTQVNALFDSSNPVDHPENPKPVPPKKEKTMPDTTVVDKPEAATLSDLKAACPGADSDFLLEQLEGNATVDQAMRAFMAKQKADLDKAKADADESSKTIKAELDDLKAKLADAKAKPPGNDPVGDDDDTVVNAWDGKDATATWKQKLLEKTTAGLTPHEAALQVDSEHEGLRDAYLAQHAVTYKSPEERMEAARR